MKTLTIPSASRVVLLLGFTILVNIIVLRAHTFSLAQAGLGAVWLFVAPGWMIASLIKLRASSWWENFCYWTGFGILAVMIWALIINTVLPHLGNPHPLGRPALLIWLDVGWLSLLVATWYRSRGEEILLKLPSLKTVDVVTILSGLPLVGLAIMGAISLNNGSTAAFTWIMLVLAAIYLATIVALRERLSETAIGWAIYWVSLSVLLMTSLRGWLITGHDIQLEYFVFATTLTNLHWNIADFRDAYNACLSITILPTVIHQIMGIAPTYIYKTVFQMFFALVPLQVYLIARRFNGRLVAILASIYFVAFPTFFQDMPYLNRQEVAFLFMGLIFMTAFNYSWSLQRRRLLIFMLGVGVVVSHYTTAYFMLALFGLVLALRFLAAKWQRVVLTRRRTATKSDWRRLRQTGPVSALLVVGLVIGTYIWSDKLTNTGGNLTSIVSQTISSITTGASADSKSSDTSYSLFGGSKLTDQQRLNAYATEGVATIRAASPAIARYSEASTSTDPPKVVPLANMPLTSVGKFLGHLIPVVRFNTILRQGSAVFLQLALLAGVAMLFLIRPMRRRLERDWRLFQLASVIFVGAVVLLPVLSAQYGVLRAFQQILMVCAASIVLVTILIIPERFHRARTLIPSILAIGFFFSSTGVITSALGGYPAQLQLANAGAYYDLYYTHDPERQAASWLATTIEHSNELSDVSASVVSNGYLFVQVSQLPNSVVSSNGIYPGVLPTDGYVFLGYTAAVKHEAVIYDNGDLITYHYPTSFLDSHKDLIYTNSESEVYR